VIAAVLDASVQVGWLIGDEPWHEAALAIGRQIASGRLDVVVAPDHRFEVCNALVKAVRRRRLSWEEAEAHLVQLDRFALPVATNVLDPAEVMRTCRGYGLGWGDAHHALLARRLELPLLTADQRLVRALHGSDIWVESILDRPADSAVD
jgi:predicted nucleic acid-binding protein